MLGVLKSIYLSLFFSPFCKGLSLVIDVFLNLAPMVLPLLTFQNPASLTILIRYGRTEPRKAATQVMLCL